VGSIDDRIRCYTTKNTKDTKYGTEIERYSWLFFVFFVPFVVTVVVAFVVRMPIIGYGGCLADVPDS